MEDNKNMYITIKLIDNSIRVYSTEKEATDHSIEINKSEEDHPAFDLYKLNGKDEATFIGRLSRRFGDDELFWENK